MIIAVTGGTGFIGRHLIDRHLAQGDEVRYLTRNPSRKDLNGARPFSGHLNSSIDHLRPFLSDADVLYHCAAELRHEALMASTNVEGTANLLAASSGRIKRWVQLSSTGVYGNPRHRVIDEDSPIAPVNVYEQTKAAADELVLSAASEQNLECVLIRPSNVYGIDMPNQSLFQWIRMIDKGLFFYIGQRGAIANYIHVENVVDALMLCGQAELPDNGQAYIVSDHCRLEEFVEIVSATLDKPSPRLRLPEAWVRALAGWGKNMTRFPLTSSRIDALTNRTLYKTDKLESELGYRRCLSIRDGIAELARNWKQLNSPSRPPDQHPQ